MRVNIIEDYYNSVFRQTPIYYLFVVLIIMDAFSALLFIPIFESGNYSLGSQTGLSLLSDIILSSTRIIILIKLSIIIWITLQYKQRILPQDDSLLIWTTIVMAQYLLVSSFVTNSNLSVMFSIVGISFTIYLSGQYLFYKFWIKYLHCTLYYKCPKCNEKYEFPSNVSTLENLLLSSTKICKNNSCKHKFQLTSTTKLYPNDEYIFKS